MALHRDGIRAFRLVNMAGAVGSSVIFVTHGARPTARPYHGLSPSSWAADTARLNANAERSLADEAGGPVAQLLPVPQDGGDDSEDDPLAMLRKDIRDAKGKALLVETVASGWGEGKTAAPQSDWQQRRLGPQPTEAMVEARGCRVRQGAGRVRVLRGAVRR